MTAATIVVDILLRLLPGVKLAIAAATGEIGAAELRAKVRKEIAALADSLAELDASEQAELDAAVPRF